MKFLISIVLLLSLTPSFSQQNGDTINIPFLGKQIEMQHSTYFSIQIKRECYLFVKDKCDSILKCFVIKGNKIRVTGKLVVVHTDKWIALRQGQWIYNNRKKDAFKSFDNDKEIIEDPI